MLLHPTPESQQYQTERPILQAQALAKYYGNRDRGLWALDHIDLEVYPGEFLGIMGPSGTSDLISSSAASPATSRAASKLPPASGSISSGHWSIPSP